MLFSPSPRRKRLQLRLSERRLLLMLGDALAIVVAVNAVLPQMNSIVAKLLFGIESERKKE